VTPSSGDHDPATPILGAEVPVGTRFIGPEEGLAPGWLPQIDSPAVADLDSCVACGLCLPHCPTYRLTGEESASPRGRIAAMRAVSEGRAEVDDTFATFMDLCLSCRACEDVCPSHVPFGRMMERARAQIEPLRPTKERGLRRLGLDLVLSRGWMITLATALAPVATPFLPRRLRKLLPRMRVGELMRHLPRTTEPSGGVPVRGTAALLSGCVQDRWYREVNRATIRVLVRNGWRVVVPRRQACCGALHAHYGHLGAARRLARRNLRAFEEAEVIVVNAAGCGAHLKELGELLEESERATRLGRRVRDVMEFLDEQGIEAPHAGGGVERVAYHDACHALRAQRIWAQPRAVLRRIPGLEIEEIPDGDRCCGAAGLYNVLQPEMSGQLMRQKAEAIASMGARVVASANPGCTMQITAGLRDLEERIRVVHPIQILDRAYAAEDDG
jgi:glycolate dehydrogenase iron-sulfur subunit